MRRAVALLLMFCAVLTTSAAWAERRVALVIGNGAYQHVNKLPNPANDAQAMAAMLQKVGFDVISGFDLTQKEMGQRIGEFGASLQGGADTAVIFYAGHGMQIDGKNFLIPVDADIHNITDAKINTVDAQTMLDSASEAKVKIVLLDACRDNPFAAQMAKADVKSRGVASTRGLAPINPDAGMMINFATSPGSTALDGADGHSPFTHALLNNLATPGIEIEAMMTKVRADVQAQTNQQQVPWTNASLATEVYILPGAAPVQTTSTSSTPAPSAGGAVDNSVENTFWQSAQSSGRRDEYQLYLNKYPKGVGHFSELAEMRLAELDKGGTANPGPTVAPVAPTPQLDLAALKTQDANFATETALGIDTMAWRNLQSHLAGAGFLTSGIDGTVGDGTRKAILNWQNARQYKPSGFLNKPQMDALLTEPTVVQPPAQTRSAGIAAPRPTNYNHARQAGGSGGGGGGMNPGAAIFGTVLGVFACKATHTC